MIYSVYDHRARRWHYFEGGGSIPTTAFFRDSGVGAGPDRLAMTLPPDAVAIGSGERPRGVVAVEKGASAALAPGAGLGLGLGQVPGDSTAPSGVLAWLGLAVLVGGAFWVGRRSVGATERAKARVRRALS